MARYNLVQFISESHSSCTLEYWMKPEDIKQIMFHTMAKA